MLIAQIIKTLFIISALTTIVMVFAQFSKSTHWSIRMFDFPVKQVALVHIVLSILFLAFEISREHTSLLVLFVLSTCSTLFLIHTIIPYTAIYPVKIQKSVSNSQQSISILSANVFMDNSRFDLLKEQVRLLNPDCLLLLETDQKWMKTMEYLEEDYPHQVTYPLDNTYGLLFYSKYELQNPEIRFILKSDIPSLRCRLKVSENRSVWFYGVHPEPPSPTESDTSEPRDIELIKLAKEIREIKEPVIFAGDFNDVAWSHTTRLFRRFSGLLDPRIGRGTFSTFHVKYPMFRWPLDHFFLSSHFTINKMKVLTSINSDHFPIYIKINIDFKETHSAPRVELEDALEVQEKLEKEDEHF